VYLPLLLPRFWKYNIPCAAFHGRLCILRQINLMVSFSPVVIYQCLDKLYKMYKHIKIFWHYQRQG